MQRFLYEFNDGRVTIKVWGVIYYNGSLVRCRTIHPRK